MRTESEIKFILFCIGMYTEDELNAIEYVSIESVKKVINNKITNEEYAFGLQCSEYVKQKTLNAILWLSGEVDQESVIMNHGYF